jgi:hypothetical protein
MPKIVVGPLRVMPWRTTSGRRRSREWLHYPWKCNASITIARIQRCITIILFWGSRELIRLGPLCTLKHP